MTEEGQKFVDVPQRRSPLRKSSNHMNVSKIAQYWEGNSRRQTSSMGYNSPYKIARRNERNPSLDSNIWEQWNFERKLDQSPHTPALPMRFHSFPHKIPLKGNSWSFQLREEIKTDILRLIQRCLKATYRYRGSLEEAWTWRNFNQNPAQSYVERNKGFEKQNYYHHTDPDYHEKKNLMNLRCIGKILLNSSNIPLRRSRYDQNHEYEEPGDRRGSYYNEGYGEEYDPEDEEELYYEDEPGEYFVEERRQEEIPFQGYRRVSYNVEPEYDGYYGQDSRYNERVVQRSRTPNFSSNNGGYPQDYFF